MKIEVTSKNYAAVVVELSQFVELAGCDNVKAALIFGNSVIVSKNACVGDVGLFFPVETQLDPDFCKANNLFRKPEWGNVDPTQKGFFEEHGRVKAVKFRGHKSEGFWIPITALAYIGITDLPVGTEFNSIEDYPICKKYVPKTNRVPGVAGKQGRMARAEDKIVDGQFRFHIDTENLRRNSHKLDPNTWISISEKWHGTSGVWANVLVKRELNWFERLLKRFCGVKIAESQYGLVWSSRRVVKGVDGESKANAEHFYTSDIWGTVAKEIESRIPKGYTLYGEIVGFTPDGSPIQKGYHYGCGPNEHKLVIYRATITNADNKVLELSWQQLKDFCAKYGFEMVKELWHGRAADLCPGFTGQPWHEAMVKFIEANWVKDEMCFYNNREVPAEGVVVKVDRLEEDEAYKLKSFRFLSYESAELDKGEADMETQESEVVPE